MRSLLFSKIGIFVSFGLALFVLAPDMSRAFGPDTSNATVAPGGTRTKAPGSDRRATPSMGSRSGDRIIPNMQPKIDSGSRVPGIHRSGARIVPNMQPNFSSRQRSRGFGIYIGPRRLIPVRGSDTSRPVVQFHKPKYRRPAVQPARKQSSARVPKMPPVKLARPRVPYLTELAMDIKQPLIELVKRDPIKAVRSFEQASIQAMQGKDLARRWEASTDLGHVYYLTGRFAQAAAKYSQSAEISRSRRNLVGEGISLRNLAAASTASGEYNRAEKQDLAALEIFKSAARAKDAQMTLNNLGVIEKNRGLYRDAADYYDQALEINPNVSEIRVLSLRNLGNLHKSWGEYEQAVDSYAAYGNAAASLGKQSEAAEALLDVGSVYVRQGLYDRALLKFRQAIRMQSAAKIPTDWSKKLMGDLLLEMNRSGEAEHYITEAGYDSSRGLLHLLKSEPQTAKKHYERLLEAATKEQNLDEMFTAHTGLGRVCEATQDYAGAEQHYTAAIGITEEIRASLLLSERRNFFAEKVGGFARLEAAKGLARVAFMRNNPVAGIYASEVTKAREFADNLSRKTQDYYIDVPGELLEKEAELTNKVAALKTALNAVPKGLDNSRFEEMVNQIKREDVKRKALVGSLCDKYKEYCSVKYPQPVTLENSRIDDTEYVLLFDLLGEAVGITLLKGKQVVSSHLAPWSAAELEKQVRNLRIPFEQVQLARFSPELAATLYQQLLAEAFKSVPQGASVIIVPDGPLALLPFEALVVGGKPVWKEEAQGDCPSGITYVADLYPITYYQSLTTMTLVRTLGKDRTSAKALLVMADPVFSLSDIRLAGGHGQVSPLQESAKESSLKKPPRAGVLDSFNLTRLSETEELAKSLKGLLGASCELYTGLECTKRTFLQKFAGKRDPYSAVVFATHGFAANDLPGIMEPALAMTMVPQGTDGVLSMSEVAGLKMDVDIAALTACKTGLGLRLAGEGVMSMGRAFQSGGAKSVIMSLWSVAERPSILLMQEFFVGLAQGKSKLSAWMDARAHIRRQGFEHPFFWASFILVGETN